MNNMKSKVKPLIQLKPLIEQSNIYVKNIPMSEQSKKTSMV